MVVHERTTKLNNDHWKRWFIAILNSRYAVPNPECFLGTTVGRPFGCMVKQQRGLIIANSVTAVILLIRNVCWGRGVLVGWEGLGAWAGGSQTQSNMIVQWSHTPLFSNTLPVLGTCREGQGEREKMGCKPGKETTIHQSQDGVA